MGSTVVAATGVNVGGILLPTEANSASGSGNMAGAASVGSVGSMVVLVQADALSSISNRINNLIAICCI